MLGGTLVGKARDWRHCDKKHTLGHRKLRESRRNSALDSLCTYDLQQLHSYCDNSKSACVARMLHGKQLHLLCSVLVRRPATS